MDSGCNQTSIHQSLMQQRALDMSRKVNRYRLAGFHSIVEDSVCGCFLADGAGQEEVAAQAGEALAAFTACLGGTRASEGVKPPELDDFPLEQSRDETLKNAFDQVRSVDGQLLQPDVPLSFPYFSIMKERLYRVT